MANLYISEYSSLATDPNAMGVPVGSEPSEATQKVSYTTATQSSAFGGNTRFVRVIADADAHLLFGANPTATASHMLVKANTAEYFGVEATQKVSVYDGTS